MQNPRIPEEASSDCLYSQPLSSDLPDLSTIPTHVRDETPPQYSPTIYRSAWVWVKFELADPFTSADKKSRSWECYQVTLNSTQLIISKRDENGVNYNYTPSYLLGTSSSNTPTPSLGSGQKTTQKNNNNKNLKSEPIIPPRIPLSTIVAKFTLQYAQVGLAHDYFKRSNVIRIRAESQQFLIQCSSLEECVNWIHSIQMGIDISLDLSDRKDVEMNDLTRDHRSTSRGSSNSAPSVTPPSGLSTMLSPFSLPITTVHSNGTNSQGNHHRFHSFHFGHHTSGSSGVASSPGGPTTTTTTTTTNDHRSNFKFHSRRRRAASDTESTPSGPSIIPARFRSLSSHVTPTATTTPTTTSQTMPRANISAAVMTSTKPSQKKAISKRAAASGYPTRSTPVSGSTTSTGSNDESSDAFKHLKRLGATSRWANEVVVGGHDELFLIDERNKVLKPIWTKKNLRHVVAEYEMQNSRRALSIDPRPDYSEVVGERNENNYNDDHMNPRSSNINNNTGDLPRTVFDRYEYDHTKLTPFSGSIYVEEEDGDYLITRQGSAIAANNQQLPRYLA